MIAQMRWTRDRTVARGMTLIELLLAVLLASLVMYALVRFVDVSLGLWSRAEESRSRHGRVQVLLDRMARDLETAHPGQTGDLLVEWVGFQLGGDAAFERVFPRLRMVRRPSNHDWQRLGLQELTIEEREQLAEAGFGSGSSSGLATEDLPGPLRDPIPGLSEVVWALMPSDKADLEGTAQLFREEQRAPKLPAESYLREEFARGGPYLQAEPLELLSDGVLWWELRLLGEDADLEASPGPQAGEPRWAWDARGLQRPDPNVASQNATAVDFPARVGYPILPSRVLLVLEIERSSDRERRPRLAESVDREANQILVSRGERLPKPGESYVRIGSEWMRVLSIQGDRATVERGQRGTLASLHQASSIVHFGYRGERLVVIPTARPAARPTGAVQ